MKSFHLLDEVPPSDTVLNPREVSAVPWYTQRYSLYKVTLDKECPLKHVFERPQGP